MPTIDKKIVEMQFDNRDFEKGVSQSLKSLKALREGLELDKANESLEELNRTAKNFNISGIANGVDKIADRFTLLGKVVDKIKDRIADFTVSSITNFAKFASGMTTAQSGFDKYATKTKAVQTILHATGSDMDTVEKTLKKLMTYTDLTSYDFSEMVKTIGKFTASGVDLEKAEIAMEGIGNAAAVAGAETAQANHVMYNLAQALGAGHVKLQDWSSVMTANMDTKQLREELIATGIELGTLKKQSDKVGYTLSGTGKKAKKTAVDYRSFTSSLQSGWLTNEVLIKTLEKFANDKEAFEAAKVALTFEQAVQAVKDSLSTGWMNTWELLFGNVKEAGELWTNLCDSVIEFTSALGDWRNGVLAAWREQGGFNMALETANNIFSALIGISDGVRQGLEKIFPEESVADKLTNLTEKVRNFSEALKNLFSHEEEEEIERTYNTVTQYANKLSLGISKGMRGEEVKLLQERLMKAGLRLDRFGADGIFGPETQKALKEFQKQLGVTETGVWDKETRHAAVVSGRFKEVTEHTQKFKQTVGEAGKGTLAVRDIVYTVGVAIKGLWSAIKFGGSIIIGLVGSFASLGEVLKPFLGLVVNYFNSLSERLKNPETYTKTLDKIKEKIKPLTDWFDSAGSSVSKFFKEFKITSFSEFIKALKQKALQNVFKNGDRRLYNIIKAITKVKNAVKKLFDSFSTKAGAFLNQNKSKFVDWLLEKFPVLVSTVVDFVSGLADAIKNSEKLKGVWSTITSYFSKAKATVSGKSGSITDSLINFFTLDKSKSFTDNMKEKLAPVIEKFEFFKNKILDIVKLFERVKKLYDEKIKPIGETIKYYSSNIWQGIKNLFGGSAKAEEGMDPNFAKALENLDPAVDWFAKASASMTGSWNNIDQTTKSLLESTEDGGTFSKLFERAKAIGQEIKKFDFSKLIGPALIGLGVYIAISLTRTISKVGKGIAAASSGVAGLTEAFSNFIGKDSIGSIVKGFAASLSESIAKRPKDSIGTSMLKIAGSVAILAAAVALLGSSFIDVDKAKEGAQVAIALLGSMVFAMGQISKYVPNVDKIGYGLLAMAGSIGVLALGVWMMGAIVENTPAETLAKSLTIISFLLLELGAIEVSIAALSKGNGGFNIKGVLAMCAGVGVLVLSISKLVKVMNENGSAKVEKAFDYIKSMLWRLGLLEVVLAIVGRKSGVSIKISGVLSMCAGIYLLAKAIDKVAKGMRDRKHYDAAIDAVQGLLTKLGLIEIGIARATKGKDGKISGMFGGILSMCAGIALVAWAIGKIAEDYDKYPKYEAALDMVSGIMWTLSITALAMASALKILSTIPISGYVMAGAGIGVFGVIMAAIGGIVEFIFWVGEQLGGDPAKFMASGLEKLGNIIGSFFHGLYSGMKYGSEGGGAEVKESKSFIEGLKDIIKGFDEVVDLMKPFLDKAQSITRDQVAGVKNLVNIILRMTGANVIDAISAFSTELFTDKESSGSGFVDFANSLVDLVPPLATFSQTIGNVDAGSITASIPVFEALQSLSSSIVDISWDTVKENLFDFLNGDKSVIGFINQLMVMAPGLIAYSNMAKFVDAGSVEDSAVALEALGRAALAIPGADGTIQHIFGEHDVAAFGSKLGTLARGLVTYATITSLIPKGYDPSSSIAVAGALADVSDKLPKTDGALQAWLGEKNLATFGSRLGTLARGLVTFVTTTSGIKSDYNVDGPVKAIEALSKLEEGLKKHGGVVQMFTGDNSLGQFGEEIKSLGENLKSFSDDIKDVKTNKIISLGHGIDALGQGLSHFNDTMTMADEISNLDFTLGGLTEKVDWSPFETVGVGIDDAIAKGINQNRNDVVNRLRYVIVEAGSNIRSYYNAFVNAGSYLTAGLGQGIYNGGKTVIGTARMLANSVRNIIGSIWKINSPSRVGYWLGEMWDAGIANGISDYASSVTSVSGDMADSTVKAAEYGLSTFSQSLIDDTNMSPVIRPVLDLSEVQAGANGIGGYFGNHTIGIGSTNLANKISSKDAVNRQAAEAGSNANLGMTIMNLNDRINQLDDTISNMKVVMDSGALVGQIGPGMDRYLGRRQIMSRRGN